MPNALQLMMYSKSAVTKQHIDLPDIDSLPPALLSSRRPSELILGQQLFHGPSVEHVLAAQQAVLGHIPQHMVRSSATRNLYFTRTFAADDSNRCTHGPFRMGSQSLSPLPTCVVSLAAGGQLYTLDPPGYPAGAYRLVPVLTDLPTLLEVEDDVRDALGMPGHHDACCSSARRV